MSERDASAPGALAIWLMAAWFFALSDPLYPILIRGWSEWSTNVEAVQQARRLAWAAHYAVMGAALLVWMREALTGLARLAFLAPALVWFGASALWSDAPAASAFGFAQFALTVAFGIAAGVRLGPAVVAAAVFRAAVICALTSWAVALVAPLYGYGQHVNPGALRGVYVEKNHLAIFLSFGFVAGLFEILAGGRGWRPFGLALVLATAVAAKSSIGLGQAALAALIAGLFFGLAPARHGGAAALCFGVAALAALAAIFPVALAALGEDATLNGRTTLWAQVWPHIEARPVLGHGFAGYWQGESAAALKSNISWNARGAHNGWLEVLLAGGVIGAVLWGAHWANVLAPLLRALRPGGAPAPAALAAIGLAHLAWSFFESHQLAYLSYHAVIAGLVFSLAAAEGRAADGARARISARSMNSGLPST